MAKVPGFLSRIKLSCSLLSMAIAAIIMLEGAVIAATARQIDLIENWGTGLAQGAVALVGVQLLVLGLLALFCIVVNGEYLSSIHIMQKVRGTLFRDRNWLFPVFTWAPTVVGAMVAIEGLLVSYYASPMAVSGMGNVNGMWLAVFGAQLFLLGLMLTVVRLFDGRMDLPVLVRSTVLALFASFGVLVYGLADRARITGIGGIREGTIELLGIQMTVIALVAIAMVYLGDRFFLGRKFFGRKVGTLSIIALSMVLCFEGMVVASIAAPSALDSIGGMKERTMLIAGVGFAVLAMVVPASFYFLEKKDMNVRRLAYASTLFLFFMLPFPVLM